MATYYVGMNGVDTNDGTEDAPFATAQAAADVVEAGDTVLFLTGTYTNATYLALDADGNRDIWKSSSDSIVKLNGVHGTEENPIIFKPAPGAEVKLKFDGNGAFSIRDSSHIRVEGFDIEGPGKTVTKEDAAAAQYTYRIAESVNSEGQPVYTYYERDPSEVLNTKIKDIIKGFADEGIEQSGSGKPMLWNAPAISLPKGSHHIEVVNNTIHHSAAHAVSGHGGNDYVTVSGNEIYNNNWYTTNGTHAVSFKSLNSIDDVDGYKVVIEGNHIHDNHNLMISWVTSKTFVTQHIDEGKSIHIQNSEGTVDPETGYQWDHGRILIANNLIERAGNAAVTFNNVRGGTFTNNTIIDPGHVNHFIDQNDDPDSAFYQFFTDQGLPADYRVAVGGLRLTDAEDNIVTNNLISISDDRVYAVDASAGTDGNNTTASNNIFSGGKGVRFRADEANLGDIESGFTSANDLGFVDAANGDYNVTHDSIARDAGTNFDEVTHDHEDGERYDGHTDVGAFEHHHDGHDRPTPTYADEQAEGAAQRDIQYSLDPSNPDSGQVGTQIDGLDVWNAYRTAQHIVRGGSDWQRDGDSVVTYSFSDVANVGAGFEVFEEINQAHTHTIFEKYAEVSGVTFSEVGATADADITLKYREGSNGGGYWNGSNVVVSRVGWEPEMEAGTYNMRLMLHEVGHALGLSHPGNYNGSSATYADADHWNDSRQYTNLSYWGESNTGGSFGSMSTLGLHDILATQIEYGINWDTRSENNTYGFNSNSGISYDFTSTRTSSSGAERANTDMAFSIWDGGGVDTLDFSGSNTGTELDLREGSFSSTNGQTYNVSIAYGAVVENGVGSAHDDTIIGNGTANNLKGGDGDDVIIGGAETVVDTTVDARHFTGIEINADPLTRDQYIMVEEVSALSGDAFTIEMMVELIRSPSSLVAFASYAVPGSSNELLIEGQNNGVLKISLNGSTYNTAIETATLVDGLPHRLSVSWDSATGQLDTYIDGVLADTGIHQQGSPLASGGTLVFGQEQDSVGGGFDGRQIFSGTMGDIRIFDTVRTAQDIDDNKFGFVAADADGLLHNWQVEAGDTATITDVATVNPPIDLTSLMPAVFTTSQSSSYNSTSLAGLFHDDDISTSNHTLNSGDEWVRMDFDQVLEVTHVEIVNRPSWGSRLDGTTISVLDAEGQVLYTSEPISGVGSGATFTLALPTAMAASAVRLDQDTNYLHIAELNILGNAPDGFAVDPALLNTDATIVNGGKVNDTSPVIDTTPDNDRLMGGFGNDTLKGGAGKDYLVGEQGDDILEGGLGDDILIAGASLDYFAAEVSGQSIELTATLRAQMTATQSDVWSDNEASYGAANLLDGDLSTMAHTRDGPHWIEIDMGGMLAVTEVQIQNRDGFESRLNGAVVTLQDESGATIHTFDTITNAGDLVTLTLPTVTQAHALRIEKLSGSVLNLMEVDIFGNITRDLIDGENMLDGGAGDDILFAGAGADILRGGDGIDLLAFDRSSEGVSVDLALNTASGGDAEGDTIDGFERVRGSAHDDALSGDDGINIIVGRDGDDTLNGNGGDDALRGGNGADALIGGDGVDLADYSDVQTALIVDLQYSGNNTGQATGDTYTTIENLTATNADDNLRGDAGGNVIVARDGDDFLSGRDGDDMLIGSAGNDTLRGGNGADILVGGSGIDAADYRDFSAGLIADLQFSNNNTGAATGDSYVAIENLLASNGDDSLRGDGFDNLIIGLNGNDFISGRSGADTLIGNNGDDVLRGGTGGDTLNGGSGQDRADYSDASFSVRADLANSAANAGAYALGDTYIQIEDIRGSNGFSDDLRGDENANVLEGLAGDDELNGRGGDDTLAGGLGDDTLIGGSGNDVLIGGGGADVFIFTSPTDGVDSIIGFAVDSDVIHLDDAGFMALSIGAVAADNFHFGDEAVDANDFLIYDGSTLFYDADGNGAETQVAITSFNNGAALDENDLLIV